MQGAFKMRGKEAVKARKVLSGLLICALILTLLLPFDAQARQSGNDVSVEDGQMQIAASKRDIYSDDELMDALEEYGYVVVLDRTDGTEMVITDMEETIYMNPNETETLTVYAYVDMVGEFSKDQVTVGDSSVVNLNSRALYFDRYEWDGWHILDCSWYYTALKGGSTVIDVEFVPDIFYVKLNVVVNGEENDYKGGINTDYELTDDVDSALSSSGYAVELSYTDYTGAKQVETLTQDTTITMAAEGEATMKAYGFNDLDEDFSFDSVSVSSTSVMTATGMEIIDEYDYDGREFFIGDWYLTANKRGESTVTVTVGSYKVNINVNVLFEDITDESKYFFDPVYWAAENGITTGRSGGIVFDAFATCTRAEIVTFLWRLAGQPEPKASECQFSDISTSAYYYKSVQWAYEQGITTGRSGGTTFDPNGTCTRREIVTFLWRYAGKPKPSSTGTFSDVTDSSAYYYNAVYWAAEQGITTGKSGGNRFDPLGECTRAMAVTFLYRYSSAG